MMISSRKRWKGQGQGSTEIADSHTYSVLALKTVEELHGPLAAKQLRDEAEADKTWSLS